MIESEQAILKTLIYSDIFQYPLTKEEIIKYLIDKKIDDKEVERSLQILLEKKTIESNHGFYFISPQKSLVKIRQKRADISRKKIVKAKKWVHLLRLNPFLKMVAITGTLAVENAETDDDIDLMLVFSKNRLFLGRLIEYVILKLIGKRRNPQQKEARDLLCPNLYLSEENLRVKDQNLFIAHEIVQMKMLWDRGKTYERFINENRWVSKFLPNWGKEFRIQNSEFRIKKKNGFIFFDLLEKVAKKLQLKYMQTKISCEKVSDKALYFHPHDVKKEIMEKYQQKLEKFGLKGIDFPQKTVN